MDDGSEMNSAARVCRNLLKTQKVLQVRIDNYESAGFKPQKRPLADYLRYGILNLHKPSGITCDEIVSEIKRILEVSEVEYMGRRLGEKSDGCLIVCLNRSTRIVEMQSQAVVDNSILCTLDAKVNADKVFRSLETLSGAIFQTDAGILRTRSVYETKLRKFDDEGEGHLIQFDISCEADTCIETLCKHLGWVLGVGLQMVSVRRTKFGILGQQYHNMVELADVEDAQNEKDHDDSYLRRVILPVEVFLARYKRLVVKDSVVNKLCSSVDCKGFSIGKVVKFDNGIEVGDDVVLMTTKGEGIALGVAVMSSLDMARDDKKGVVVRIKTVVVDKTKEETGDAGKKRRIKGEEESASGEKKKKIARIDE